MTVPGAPPWSLGIDLPAAGQDYLLESTVTVASPADRRDVTAAPELRVSAEAGGQPAELQPAAAARSVIGRGAAVVTTHAWLRASQAGRHQVELITLQLAPTDLAPRAWRLRLAEHVPAQPSGAGLAVAGFVLLAAALLGWLARPAAQSVG